MSEGSTNSAVSEVPAEAVTTDVVVEAVVTEEVPAQEVITEVVSETAATEELTTSTEEKE